MPDMPLVDTHLLLWDPERHKMPWLSTDYWTDEESVLAHPYGLAEFDRQRDGVEVGGLVFVEVGVAPAYGLLEAKWANAIAERDPRLQGIVAWAPMEYGEQARAYLEAVVAIGPRVKGVRQVLELQPADFCVRPGFDQAVGILAEYGLSFELAVKKHQLANATELVRRHPDVQFMLNHIGKPGILSHEREPWWSDIATIAALPNVFCKVSGAITEADFKAWTLDDIRPYVERVLEVFGEDRVVFAGDWPVVLLASTYVRWVEAAETLVAGLSADAKRKFWADNARRFYRLDP
jgi:L-fuconolactonase